MTECATTGCDNDAEHTVTFDDPEEEVPYCTACAKYQYFDSPQAIGVSRGASS